MESGNPLLVVLRDQQVLDRSQVVIKLIRGVVQRVLGGIPTITACHLLGQGFDIQVLERSHRSSVATRTTEVNRDLTSRKLLCNLRGMTDTTSTVNLSAPVWRIEEVASFLRLASTKCAYRIVAQSDFPASVVPGKRNRRWLAEDVKTFFESRKDVVASPVIAIDKSAPRNIIRGNKAKVA